MSEFTISAHLNIQVSKTIHADSLEAALTRAKGFRESDFIKIPPNCYEDGQFDIIGIYENDTLPLR